MRRRGCSLSNDACWLYFPQLRGISDLHAIFLQNHRVVMASGTVGLSLALARADNGNISAYDPAVSLESLTLIHSNIPIGCCRDFVQIFTALLAKVLLRAHSFIHDPNAASMLPDLTNITLYKQTTSILW